MGKTLVMNFLTVGGRKTSVSFKNVREDIDPLEVSSVMDTIIGQNIFMTSSGDVKFKDSAYLEDKVIEDLGI